MSAQPAAPKAIHARPLLSICIPTYNRAGLLAQTLTHVRSVCSGDDVEVVISDNCSPDETQAVIAEFAPRFRHFGAIRQVENRGGMPNLAAAIALASGEFIYTLNDDDEIFIDGLAAAISIMKSDERIVAVYGGYEEWSREAGRLSAPISAVEQRVDFAQGEKLQIFNRCSLLWYPVCRRQFLQRFFTYDERTFGFWELVPARARRRLGHTEPDLQALPNPPAHGIRTDKSVVPRSASRAVRGLHGPNRTQRLSAAISVHRFPRRACLCPGRPLRRLEEGVSDRAAIRAPGEGFWAISRS